jgi:sortase A
MKLTQVRAWIFSRRIDSLLLAVGCSLLLAYFLVSAFGFASAGLGIWSYRTHHPLDASSVPARHAGPLSGVDVSLWSEKRIRAYKEAIGLKVTPPLGVLSIDAIKLQVPIYEGTDDLTLNRGAGRIAGTAPLGTSGNTGVAAHRDGFFRGLKDVRTGDQITLETPQGRFFYAIDEIKIVNPDDVSVLQPRARPSLTLVTCYPFYFVGDAPQRYIVEASLARSEASTTTQLRSALTAPKEAIP